jgi:hypothetical protein
MRTPVGDDVRSRHPANTSAILRRFAAAGLIAFLALGLTGCDSPKKTVDQLRQEIAAYKAAPSDAGQAKIEADLAKLNDQIANLERKGRTEQAATYRSSAANLTADYRAARMVRTMKDAQSALQGLGQAVKDAGKSIGDAFRDTDSPTPVPRQP